MANIFTTGVSPNPMRAHVLGGVLLQAKADVGATGAVTLDSKSDPGITIQRTDTGDYSFTFPTGGCARLAWLNVVSSTIAVTRVLTWDESAGTATITCYSDAGTTAADPGSGDDIHIGIFVEAH